LLFFAAATTGDGWLSIFGDAGLLLFSNFGASAATGVGDIDP